MKTLLAIIDEPKESKEFLRYVAGMAINLTAQVKVIHVHTPANYPTGMTDATGFTSLQIKKGLDDLVDDSKKILKTHIEEINEEISSHVFTDFSSDIGFASVFASDLVENKKVDMVVMEGQHEDSFWMQTSSNMDVIKQVKCPVWIIPKGAVYKPFTDIVYATDYKKEDISRLKKLINTFPHYTPNITALHITDSVAFEDEVKKAGFVEMLKKQTDYDSLWVKTIYQSNHDDLTQLLNDFAIKSKADLLVMLKENKTFFDRIFDTNHTKEILKKTQLPVLIYHEK